MKLTDKPEIKNYGAQMKEMGFNRGWKKNEYSRKRYASLKEKSQQRRFGEFYDYIDDLCFENRKK